MKTTSMISRQKAKGLPLAGKDYEKIRDAGKLKEAIQSLPGLHKPCADAQLELILDIS
ncbi:MAG: hypothetical protein U5L72_03035 [Bacteroidales bacterium]|nr:hypothetical protein [Bacteroidales bacterium]